MNKGLVVLGLLVASLSVGALAQGFMGPAAADLNKNQWNVGYNFSYSDIDLDKTDLKWVDLGLGANGKGKFEIKDFKTMRQYVTVGYGLTSWWEVYAQLGFADVKGKANVPSTDVGAGGVMWEGGINFDNDSVWGWGTRFTLAEQGKVKWGLSGQMNWLDTSMKGKNPGSDNGVPGNTAEIDIESFDLLVAFGPTVDMGCWKLYGGPFYYYLSGDYDFNSPDGLWKEKADLKADRFGGFIGAQFALTKNLDLRTEFSATADGWAAGTSIGWKF